MNIMHFLSQNSVVAMFAIFVAIVAAAYWPSRKKRMQRYAQIPLHDDP